MQDANINFGEIPTIFFSDPAQMTVFQSAMREVRARNIKPEFTIVLDKATTFENALEALKWARQQGVVNPPKIATPYHEAEDEDEFVAMNREEYNPTSFTMLQLLGIQKAMERGLSKAFLF